MNYNHKFENALEIVKILKTIANSNVVVNNWQDLIPLLKQLDDTIGPKARWDLIQTHLLLERGLWIDIDKEGHLIVGQFEPSDIFYKTRYELYHSLETFEDFMYGKLR